jgi:hypothetical protein
MRLLACLSALCLFNSDLLSVSVDADELEGSCGWPGGFPMSEAEQTYLALEAASTRADYE